MKRTVLFVTFLLVVVAVVGAPAVASAHCDTLDGPVVATAARALRDGRLAPVLAWVPPASEPEVRASFARARAVRKLGTEARDLADQSFFETVVRIHRAGEGAPYTGLKPAGGAPDPAIAAADQAVASGKPDVATALLEERVRAGVTRRLARLHALPPPSDDVAAGRAWVAAYVDFVHFVGGVDRAAAGGTAAGGEDEAAPAHHGH